MAKDTVPAHHVTLWNIEQSVKYFAFIQEHDMFEHSTIAQATWFQEKNAAQSIICQFCIKKYKRSWRKNLLVHDGVNMVHDDRFNDLIVVQLYKKNKSDQVKEKEWNSIGKQTSDMKNQLKHTK